MRPFFEGWYPRNTILHPQLPPPTACHRAALGLSPGENETVDYPKNMGRSWNIHRDILWFIPRAKDRAPCFVENNFKGDLYKNYDAAWLLGCFHGGAIVICAIVLQQLVFEFTKQIFGLLGWCPAHVFVSSRPANILISCYQVLGQIPNLSNYDWV